MACSLTLDSSLSSRWSPSEGSLSSIEASSRAASCYIERQKTASKRLRSTRSATTKDPHSLSLPILSTALSADSPRLTGSIMAIEVTVKPFCSRLIRTRSISRRIQTILFVLTAVTGQYSEVVILFLFTTTQTKTIAAIQIPAATTSQEGMPT